MATPTTQSLPVGESPPPLLTLEESLAHVSRCKRWTGAVFTQILCLGIFLAFAYYNYKSEISPAPFSSNPWLLTLLISLGAYLSLVLIVRDYACLFLPRTPVAIVEKIQKIGMLGVGLLVIGGMVIAVLLLDVRDPRVLAACNAVAHAFIVCLVGFWVWLARTYGGDNSDGGDALDGASV